MREEEAIKIIKEKILVTDGDATNILEKAKDGQEITEDFTLEKWLNERFLPNCISITEEGYAKMCVDALKILSTTAATDYGGSRQRDLGQLWADMTRGYLGELALLLFLENKAKIKAELGHEIGAIEEFLPMDIHKIKTSRDLEYRKPKINISIKATKWNGIWLDIPGDQFTHSDIHVFVKVGTGRDHLFAFFKSLSVFKDKVLKKGEEVGVLSSEESLTLYNSLPNFSPIPAYICGFVKKDQAFKDLPYEGKKGRIHYTITSWNGARKQGDLEEIKAQEKISGKGEVSFLNIGKFAHNTGYLFNTGNLLWQASDWKKVFDSI